MFVCIWQFICLEVTIDIIVILLAIGDPDKRLSRIN